MHSAAFVTRITSAEPGHQWCREGGLGTPTSLHLASTSQRMATSNSKRASIGQYHGHLVLPVVSGKGSQPQVSMRNSGPFSVRLRRCPFARSFSAKVLVEISQPNRHPSRLLRCILALMLLVKVWLADPALFRRRSRSGHTPSRLCARTRSRICQLFEQANAPPVANSAQPIAV